MQLNLFEVKSGESCLYLRCKNIQKEKELTAYGFISGVNVDVISKTKYSIVIRVLDGVFSLNRKLASEILVEVKKYER